MSAEEKLLGLISTKVVSGRVTVSGYDIHYVQAGSGPDLLLVHGINMGWGQWYPNLADFAKHFTVYAIDLPGSGDSSALHPYDPKFPESLVDVVRGFIKVKQLKKVGIVGHSVGAWVALRVAEGRDVELGKLVLVSPLGFSKKTPAKYRALGFKASAGLLSKTAMKLSRKNMKTFTTSVFHRPETLRDEFADYYYEALLDHGHAHPFLWINRFSGFSKIKKEFVLLDRLSRISEPTLIIAGAKDGIVPPSSTHLAAFKLLPNAEVIIFPESGHVPPTEEHMKFNQAVIQFLME